MNVILLQINALLYVTCLAFPSPFYDKVGLVGLLLLSDIVIGSEAKTFFASFIVDVT
jgi:hypothetical protein